MTVLCVRRAKLLLSRLVDDPDARTRLFHFMVWPSRRLMSKPVVLMAVACSIASAQNDRGAASICTDALFTVHIHEHGNGDWVELSTSPPSDLHATIRSPVAKEAFHGTYCLPPNRVRCSLPLHS